MTFTPPPGYGGQPMSPWTSHPRVTTGIRLTMQSAVLGIHISPPPIKVNGKAIAVPYGTSEISLPPGRYVVECEAMGRGVRYGRNHMEVDVLAGHLVPVFYKPPLLYWSKGAMGHTLQKTPDTLQAVILFAFAILVPTIVVIVKFGLGGW